MSRARLAAVVAAGLAMSAAPSAGEVRHTVLTFADLEGWSADDHAEALSVFLETCPDLDGPDWPALCALATQTKPEAARSFFELFFRPVLIEDGAAPLFTGYFEPELNGSPVPTARYRYPLYRLPPELRDNPGPWLTRAEIESGALEGRGLEIAWVDDPVELFFLHVQGSGRIRYPDGSGIRVGYAGSNGRPYRSIGEEMVRRGIYAPHQVSAAVIRNWVRRNPVEGRRLLQHNPSFVFFRVIDDLADHEGPRGAMNRPLTPLRSLAVDPAFVPLGAPVWIEKAGRAPMRRLMVAQDTGSAIKGAQRADIFFGTGRAAGRAAGKIRDPGRLVVLLPIPQAYALAPEGQG
ncbi:membrane-bound lytic murein transglycosylase A [Meinhardsimonia xiamenensis]|jgi:membrane-bound lytic murein transglycosylase A|uniref:peptidoglycan lytic exotransglycosylase n=1 Tax=Meinhardsimonia xiamenensis TaxID=990712 RepID=A0A1G8Y4N5_9RHOB|nr:MltA domain-containing protein [Meinhardsimonia xiamenensis]PRX37162.1 membrane-bound lytic murein transglycosylase A [Meinhardsimonia xiamenensis]SDJ97693.1 membrane-bound lytic murein transglycosylase A [Meinhardsimonia xiamenensis]